MTRRFAVLAAPAALALCLGLAACDAGGTTAPATPSAADASAPQPHQLYTHCGVVFTEFQGITWYADPPLSDGNGNPPAGFGNPTDRGTMRRVSQHEAQYLSSAGRTVKFVDTLPAGASPPGLCS